MISHLIPGAYIEQVEFGISPIFSDSTKERNPCFEKCTKLAEDCTRVMEKSFHIAYTLKQSIMDAGFVDVVETVHYIPLGTWMPEPEWKEIGRWYRNFWEAGMEGWWMASATRHLGVIITSFLLLGFPRGFIFTNVLICLRLEQWSAEEVKKLAAEIIRAVDGGRNHTYCELYVGPARFSMIDISNSILN